LHITPYTFEEFVEIAVRLLGENCNLLADVSIAIANKYGIHLTAKMLGY
jgi:hypothetical protein